MGEAAEAEAPVNGAARKKNANPQHTDTSPPLPDLQAQTLFAPGTTGGAADEETVDQAKLK